MAIQKEKEAFEAYMAEQYECLIDRRVCINSDGDYLAWDMQVAWKVWQAAKAQAVPEWISVEDELPPSDTMVLICWSDSPNVEPEKDFMDVCVDTGCPFWANSLNDEPSHWMPLPEPPKAQEHGHD